MHVSVTAIKCGFGAVLAVAAVDGWGGHADGTFKVIQVDPSLATVTNDLVEGDLCLQELNRSGAGFLVDRLKVVQKATRLLLETRIASSRAPSPPFLKSS